MLCRSQNGHMPKEETEKGVRRSRTLQAQRAEQDVRVSEKNTDEVRARLAACLWATESQCGVLGPMSESVAKAEVSLNIGRMNRSLQGLTGIQMLLALFSTNRENLFFRKPDLRHTTKGVCSGEAQFLPCQNLPPTGRTRGSQEQTWPQKPKLAWIKGFDSHTNLIFVLWTTVFSRVPSFILSKQRYIGHIEASYLGSGSSQKDPSIIYLFIYSFIYLLTHSFIRGRGTHMACPVCVAQKTIWGSSVLPPYWSGSLLFLPSCIIQARWPLSYSEGYSTVSASSPTTNAHCFMQLFLTWALGSILGCQARLVLAMASVPCKGTHKLSDSVTASQFLL